MTKKEASERVTKHKKSLTKRLKIAKAALAALPEEIYGLHIRIDALRDLKKELDHTGTDEILPDNFIKPFNDLGDS